MIQNKAPGVARGDGWEGGIVWESGTDNDFVNYSYILYSVHWIGDTKIKNSP